MHRLILSLIAALPLAACGTAASTTSASSGENPSMPVATADTGKQANAAAPETAASDTPARATDRKEQTLPAADPLKTESPDTMLETPAKCGADKVQSYVGKDASDAVRASVQKESGAKTIRWITPDMMVTMDYSESRLNAHLSTDGKIGSFKCG